MTRAGPGAPDTSAGALSYVWTDAALRALRRALESERFTEILPAILSSRFEPGARHSVAVLGRRAYFLTAEEESLLASDAASPFWIHDYPEGVRDSLYRRNARGTCDTYDLMLPFGCGELPTGGLRPESGGEVRRQSRALGIAAHPGYAEWKERTRIQSGGFGAGLERLVRFCCAARSVLDVRRGHDSGPNAGIELES